MKPLIALSGNYENNVNAEIPAFSCGVGSSYMSAVIAGGGVPVLALGGDFAELARRCDGVLFTGGDDVDPALFGEEKVNDTVSVTPRRDEAELALFRAFFSAGKPIFGICRGIQLINVALGGSLWQDIPSQQPSELVHRKGAVHPVKTECGSRIAGLFGPSFMSNSYHHQSVKRPGEGMRVTACAPDGIVECIEHESLPVMGVQFHPERMTGPWLRGDLPDTARLCELWMRLCGRE